MCGCMYGWVVVADARQAGEVSLQTVPAVLGPSYRRGDGQRFIADKSTRHRGTVLVNESSASPA